MRTAQLNQLVGIRSINIFALRLNIGAEITADIRAFVPSDTDHFQRIVDDINRAFDIAFLISVFNAQQKIAAGGFGYQIFIKRGAQVADVHIAGRTWSKTGTGFHFIFLYYCISFNAAARASSVMVSPASMRAISS